MADPITVKITNLNSPIATVKVSNKVGDSAVTSVAGRVGDILLTQADVAGLENVNNTSDLDKPVSTATQAAIDNIDLSGYALVDHQHLLADITNAGTAAAADTGDFATASHTHLLGDITDAGTAAGSDISDFAPFVHTHEMADITDLADGAISLTNKTLTDTSNVIHADQLHYKVKADENILKGQPVKYDSFNVGQNAINVSLADHMLDVSIGLAEEDISQGSFGNIITAGVLDHVDTTDFNEGEILYVNGQGLLTGVEPTSGFAQPIALCLKSQQNNGALQVLADYPKQPSTDVRNDSNVSGANVTEALNNLSSSLTGAYATAEQGALADSAVQPEDINTLTGLNSIVADATLLSSSQISSAYQPLSSVLTNTTASFTTSDESKLDSVASGAEVNVNADWNSVGGDSEILNKPAFGDITGSNISDFAQSSHTHTVSDITDLDTGSFSTSGHTHVVSDITDAGTMISAETGDYQLSSQKGIAGGYAGLDGGGKVPSAQLPSYVDDVLEYPSLANFPNPGEFGKLYVALDTNKIYRWSGSTYIEVSNGSTAPLVTSVNTFIGDVVLDPDDLDDSSTTNKFVDQSQIDKLSSVASGAEVNVNSDWNSVGGDSEILNKPLFGDITGSDIADFAAINHSHTTSDISDIGTISTFNSGDYSLSGHTHSTSDIVGLGTIATYDSGDYAQFSHDHLLEDVIDAGTSASYDVSTIGDAGLTQVVLGSDSRLSNARTPTLHTHLVSQIIDLDTGVFALTGHTHALSDLEQGGATHGQAVVWNSGSGSFVPSDVSAGSLSASDITNDSAVTGATVKDALDAIESGGIGGGSSEVVETSIYIDAAAFLAKDGEADASSGADNGTENSVDWYNVATAETLYAKVAMPPQWDGGVVDAEVFWTIDGGTVGENVKWEVAAQAGGNDDAWDIAFPAPTATLDDPIIANGDIHKITAESITVGGTPQDGDILHLELARATAGATAASQDARLLGVRLIYSNSLLQNWYSWKLGNETADASTGIKVTWYAPADGKIHGVAAGCATATSGSALVLDVHKNGTTIFNTKITIDVTESTTVTAATPAVLTNDPTSFSAGDKFEFEIDSTTAGGAGLHGDLLISWN